MLASVGIGTDPVWEAIKNGQSGIGPITAFDATDFNCRFAGEVKNFDPTASFVDDLGADSLDIVELVMAFEEAFDLDIPDEDAEKIATVKDAITYIESKKK